MVSLTIIHMILLVFAGVLGRDALSLAVRRTRRALDPERRRHLLEMRQILERRLRERQKQAAYGGINTDPAILMEIDDLKKQIDDIDDMLR